VQINVSQQLKSAIGQEKTYEVIGTVDIEENDVDMRGTVKLMRTNRGILVTGKIQGDIELDCGRCLGRFEHHLSLNIEEEYFPTTDVNTGAGIASPEEPGSFTIDEHNILDLTEAIRQYAVMALPIKPLCREDCAGLCPTCGANLNQVECGCPPSTADPRWEGLRKYALADVKARDRKGKK
jgi:uncharacterized protein